ncbi:hypothetical protein [Nocardioides sp.]|uniref:hypothetical protein n=1 Tax=Nocardioides sp. TaxID=35761 RepID=UPI00239963D1|nr:hypothetical protein [Nocardioides sp.]MDE0776689.1 hypothetical protein [Nocardioides sp.]
MRIPAWIVALLVALVTTGLAVAAACAVFAWALPPVAEPGPASTSTHASASTSASSAPPGSETESPAPPTSTAREVLREWDRRREDAWVAADEKALRRLYVRHAVAGRRDVALLRRWTDRGAHVTRLEPQVLEVRVVRDAGRRLVLRVTDRLALVVARIDGEVTRSPGGRPSTRRIDLRRGPEVTSRWRVASVRPVGGGATSAAG